MSLLLTAVDTDFCPFKKSVRCCWKAIIWCGLRCSQKDEPGRPSSGPGSSVAVHVLGLFVKVGSTGSIQGLLPWCSHPHRVRKGICLFWHLILLMPFVTCGRLPKATIVKTCHLLHFAIFHHKSLGLELLILTQLVPEGCGTKGQSLWKGRLVYWCHHPFVTLIRKITQSLGGAAAN